MAELLGQLDKSTPMPLYHQVKMLILKQIQEGTLQAGDSIPAEADIMMQFNISRNTVRQAVNDLVKDGYLYRLKSKGTFVAQPKITLNYMTKIESFQDQVLRSGKPSRTKVMDFSVITDAAIASELKIEPEAKIVCLFRVRSVADEPIVIVHSYLPYDICSFVLDYDLEEYSLFDLLAQSERTKVKYVQRIVEATISDEYDSKLLDISKGFPLQSFQNYAYTKDERVVEYCISKYKGNRNKFTITVYNTD